MIRQYLCKEVMEAYNAKHVTLLRDVYKLRIFLWTTVEIFIQVIVLIRRTDLFSGCIDTRSCGSRNDTGLYLQQGSLLHPSGYRRSEHRLEQVLPGPATSRRLWDPGGTGRVQGIVSHGKRGRCCCIHGCLPQRDQGYQVSPIDMGVFFINQIVTFLYVFNKQTFEGSKRNTRRDLE